MKTLEDEVKMAIEYEFTKDFWTSRGVLPLYILKQVGGRVDIRSYLDAEFNQMVLDLDLAILAADHEQEFQTGETVRYPASWWQAFKERWLPFLGVRYIKRPVVLKITNRRVCPHVEIPANDSHGRTVHLAWAQRDTVTEEYAKETLKRKREKGQ